MKRVFDPAPIMAERELLDPIPTRNPLEFQHTDEVPEGCIVIEEELPDEWGRLVDLHTHVVYAERDGRKLELQIFEPTEPGPYDPVPLPCVVIVPGSAFHEQRIMMQINRYVRLAQHGYVVAIVQYRPSEVAPFPAQIQDTKTAIRFLKKNADVYHIDPDHMAVAGDSSGAHVALMTGFTGDDEPDTDLYGEYSAKVTCIIDLYGPTVFSLMNYYPSSQNHYDADSPEGFEIGRKNVLEHPELVEPTIPMNYLSEDKPTPPLLIIHGGRDWLVPFNQSVRLYECMKKMNKEVVFYKLDHASHGCGGFETDRVLGIALDFLKKYI